eukprot:1764930-Prymnesium_polylepis.1
MGVTDCMCGARRGAVRLLPREGVGFRASRKAAGPGGVGREGDGGGGVAVVGGGDGVVVGGGGGGCGVGGVTSSRTQSPCTRSESDTSPLPSATAPQCSPAVGEGGKPP